MGGLREVRRRRPGTRVVAFRDSARADGVPAHAHAGVLPPPQLAPLHRTSTAGLVLGLTNCSLTPRKMLACGLPCVGLAGGSSEATFGADGPVAMAPFDPFALADRLLELLDDEAAWRRRSVVGLVWARERTWEAAVETGLRAALASCDPTADD